MKKLFLGLVALLLLSVIGVLGAAYMQPADYRVERSVIIKAPPEEVYSVISDFGRWGEWSPWEKLDPDMRKSVTGTPGEPGYRYVWEGNDQVGQGSMTVVRAVPNERIEIKLEFLKPFQASSETLWELKPEGESTRMTWIMEGRNEGLMAKLFSMLMGMDKMIGADFEEGLSHLKRVSEHSLDPGEEQSPP